MRNLGPRSLRPCVRCFWDIILYLASLNGTFSLGVTLHLQQALALATTYTDFPSLASLLLRPTPYPPASNPQASLIKSYLARYGDEFGSEVVRWCIEQGEARVVFAEEDVWGPIMDKLFAKDKKGKGREGEERVVRSEYNTIAWVNDMGRVRFGNASGMLLGEAAGASDLGVKHVRVWHRSSCSISPALTCLSWMVSLCSLLESSPSLQTCKKVGRWMKQCSMVRCWFTLGSFFSESDDLCGSVS